MPTYPRVLQQARTVDPTGTYARVGEGRGYVGLGDSITEATPGTGYYDLACMLSGGRMYNLFNAGNAGEQTPAIAARFDTDVIPLAPEVVTICAGANDLSQPGYSRSASIALIDGMITKARANGIIPVLVSIPPNTVSRAKVALFNRALANLAKLRRVRYVDTYSALVDPSTGTFLSGYSADGVHPTTDLGHPAAARVLAAACADLTYGQPWLCAENGDSANLITNGLFLTDTNADGLANGGQIVNADAAFSRSITTGDTAIKGNWQKLTMTAGAGTYQTLQWVVGAGASTFAEGDRLLVSCRVRTSSLTGTANWKLGYLSGTGGTYTHLVQDSQANLTDGAIIEQEITVAAGMTYCGLWFQLNNEGGTPANGVIEVAQAGIYNLTTAGSLA